MIATVLGLTGLLALAIRIEWLAHAHRIRALRAAVVLKARRGGPLR